MNVNRSACVFQAVSFFVPPLLTACSCWEAGSNEETSDSSVPAESGESGGVDSQAGNPDSSSGNTGLTDTGISIQALDPYVQPVVEVEPALLEPGEEATVVYRGELASADSLIMHYGFNGWNQVEGLSDEFQEEESSNDVFYFLEVSMDRDEYEGTFRTTVELPTDGRAMHMVFYQEETDTWDNNDSQDYSWPILFPYIGPYLTWNDETRPQDGVVVSYETSIPCLGVVRYGDTPELEAYKVGDVFGNHHDVVLGDLEPDTTYYYQLYDSVGHVSQLFSFETAPEIDSSFKFVVFADMQDTGEWQRWRDVADEVLANHSDAVFLLIPGDMAASDGPGPWWTFFDKGRDLFSGKVMMPVPGNHDTPGGWSNTDTTSFERYFDLPRAAGSETYYSFDYGNAHFLALNSEDSSAFGSSTGDQYAFGVSDLLGCWNGSTLTYDWVFATWHIPPYNAGARHFDQQWDYRGITESFQGTVDWFLGGHEHLYQRSLPLRYDAELAASGEYGNGEDDGVGYLVLPPAGQFVSTGLVAMDDPNSSVRQLFGYPEFTDDDETVDSENGFVVVIIDGKTINIQTWCLGDTFTAKDPYIKDSVMYEK